MGDWRAFIFYDHGIRDSISGLAADQSVRFVLKYKSPRDDGLPTDSEFEAVREIEDRLSEFVSSNSGFYVGRITTKGRRYFYAYFETVPMGTQEFANDFSRSSGYELQVQSREDPEKEAYWQELYPTEDDWQMIQDMKVVQALSKSGDDSSISRRIDHWVFFKSESNARKYANWLEGEGFLIENLARIDEPGPEQWKLQFYRSDNPDLYGINRITFVLRKKSQDMDGTYDGWETSVQRDNA